MAKIEIKIEGEDIEDIIKEFDKILESNREAVRKILRMLAEEAIEVIEERKIIDRGADIYIKLNRAINWRYKQQK
ncbi:MAG: hypothetical protein FE044_03340 [Thermoplasmata archaeon]|nr:MAG: hypothetical protein FE044_03340 [Thermoplasmata archaeon]KAA0009219.1 MAG: hypothetical protein FE036_00950 [Thermoplasmata archaeon]MCD6573078.1 hypothetical protein [Thermoplasmata archaeon]